MKVTSKPWEQYLKQFSFLIFDPLTTAHMKSAYEDSSLLGCDTVCCDRHEGFREHSAASSW
jgi:hypothetical protein